MQTGRSFEENNIFRSGGVVYVFTEITDHEKNVYVDLVLYHYHAYFQIY